MRVAGPALAAAVAAVGACTGTVGTVSVSLVTAPGSTVLDAATELRVVLTKPHHEETVERTASGFAIEIDLAASGSNGALVIDALDASGAVIATGASPPFPLGAIDADIAIYMAPPLSFGAAPAVLAPARDDLAAGALAYGAIFAGGRTADGSVRDDLTIYNAYNHSLIAGMAMPAPRAGAALGVGVGGFVYLFGGADAFGAAQGSFWRFDTNAAPSGTYADFGNKAGFARADQLALPLGSDQFLLTGSPVAQIGGLDGSIMARTELASLPPAGASVTASDGATATVLAGPAGITLYSGGAFTMLDTSDQTDAAVVALPDGRALVACGASDARVVDPVAGTTTPAAAVPHALPGCALAATSRHVVVIAGASATILTSDLTPVTTAPLVVARTRPRAIALPNDQVLVAGGSETLELFTPDPAE